MTDNKQLLELADRCEAAEGPDRELDALLHCVREELEFVMVGDGKTAYGSICDPSDSGYRSGNTTSPGMLYARYPDHKNPPTLGGGKRGNKVQGCTPDNFTTSLDAAMTLVPEGWGWSADSNGTAAMTAELMMGPRFDTSGATPALALCAAALRARAAS